MFGRSNILLFGFGNLAFALLVWMILKIFRANMIVDFGIITTNIISNVSVSVLVVVGLINMFIYLFPKLKDAVGNLNRNKLKKISLSYRAKSSGPKEIREQLEIMKLERPNFEVEIQNCLNLFDRIDSEFERFDQLIRINEADSLSAAKEGLVEIEQILCVYMKNIINRSVVVDNKNSSALKSFYDQYRVEICHIIEKCNELLDEGDALLVEIVESINRKEVKSFAIQLESWRKVIRSLNIDDSIEGDE